MQPWILLAPTACRATSGVKLIVSEYCLSAHPRTFAGMSNAISAPWATIRAV